jgi:hypothetical protein
MALRDVYQIFKRKLGRRALAERNPKILEMLEPKKGAVNSHAARWGRM